MACYTVKSERERRATTKRAKQTLVAGAERGATGSQKRRAGAHTTLAQCCSVREAKCSSNGLLHCEERAREESNDQTGEADSRRRGGARCDWEPEATRGSTHNTSTVL